MVTNSTHNGPPATVAWLGLSVLTPPESTSCQYPDDSRELLLLGQKCLKSRLVFEAEKCFTTALTNDLGLTAAHYWLGYLYSRQGRHEEAALELKTCLAAQPRNGHAYAELGLVYFKMGHICEARALWQQGLWLASCSDQSLSELLERMSFCVTLDGEDKVVPNLCRMAILVAEKDTDLAYGYLERAQALEPFNSLVFAAFATVFATIGRDEDAGRAWQEAIRLRPQDPGLQAELADFYFNRGNKEEAKTWVAKAVHLVPHDAAYRLLLARIEASLGHIKEAEQHLRIAHQLEPEEATINFELGHLLWCCCQNPAAIRFLGKAARAGHKEAKAFLTMINKGKGKKVRPNRLEDGGTVFEQIAY